MRRKAKLVIPNPASVRVRNLDPVPYEPGSCTTEDTEDTEDTEKSKREKQNIWSRYKGRLVTRKSSACHFEPAGRRVRNLDPVPYEPGSCTTEDAELHREGHEREPGFWV